MSGKLMGHLPRKNCGKKDEALFERKHIPREEEAAGHNNRDPILQSFGSLKDPGYGEDWLCLLGDSRSDGSSQQQGIRCLVGEEDTVLSRLSRCLEVPLSNGAAR